MDSLSDPLKFYLERQYKSGQNETNYVKIYPDTLQRRVYGNSGMLICHSSRD